MSDQNYTTSFTVEKEPNDVFDAINNVRGWWSGEVDGDTDKSGSEFTYRVPGVHYSKQKIVELIPGKKVAWDVVDAELSFVDDKQEWKGTKIVFDIAKQGDTTKVQFTHYGLAPSFQCFTDCSNAWGLLIGGNLRNHISTGEVQASPW